MYWGESQNDAWNQRKQEMAKNLPQHLLAFNEPDISSQANMDPNSAANLYMQEIVPWGKKGVKLGSPAIAYNLDWMQTFLNAVQAQGGWVDFVNLHWCVFFLLPSFSYGLLIHSLTRYGATSDLDQFKSYVRSAHQKFGKNIWVTEMGITTDSNPTESEVKQFMEDAMSFMVGEGYVDRLAWFGCFTEPVDDFASGLNALFNSGGDLSDLGVW
jgi:hypothetical protein